VWGTYHPTCYNTIAQAFSGYLIQNGDVDQPMPAFPYTADYFSGLTATTAALAALHKVRETGKGESIDIAMYEVMLRMCQYFMMDYFNGGEMCPRMSKGKDPYYAGCGLYKCADGYIVMELVGITQIEECFPPPPPHPHSPHPPDNPLLLTQTPSCPAQLLDSNNRSYTSAHYTNQP
ncbi:CoA transferase, partial [Ligilactobacillus salivarius]|nr:CoA transferase [Ligilactobacillus salivarius]